MDLSWGFLGYLATYRLSIISVGALSIVLGYRLFCKGLYPQSDVESSEFHAKIGETELSLTSAGPGLFFALFGVIVISVMIVQGNPEMTLKRNQPSEPETEKKVYFQKPLSPQKADDHVSMELTMRGNQDETGSIQHDINQGKQLEREGNIDAAIQMYRKALIQATPAMNGLAWLYTTKKNDHKELAEYLSRTTIHLCPDEANYWDTLSEILLKNKQYHQALTAKKKAASLDKSFEKDWRL
jgi:tetratricopeptide (TPR) repeat protein